MADLPTPAEQELRMALLQADISNKQADTTYKLGLNRFEPWKLVVASVAAAGTLLAAGAALMALLLKVAGKLS